MTRFRSSKRRTSITPNRSSARPLRGAAMATTFGRDIDPDRLRGKAGADMDGAMDRYEVFHAKRPLRTVDLGVEMPKKVVPVGQMISTMYRTDKWHEDGDDEDYKHVHDPEDGRQKEYRFGEGVVCYEPAQYAKKSRVEGRRVHANLAEEAISLPVKAPRALTLLGYCLGFFVQRFDDSEIYEVNPRGCYLFCSPAGDMLAVFSPDKQPDGSSGILAIMAGGKLDVIKDGIVG